MREVDLWNFTITFSSIHVMLVKRSYFVWIWKKIGPAFFALALGSSTYFPTILELRELKTDVSDWKNNNGPNVVSLSIFGSNHQPRNANNNNGLTHSFLHYRQTFFLQYYLVIVVGRGGGGGRVGVFGGGGRLMTEISVENSTWTFPQYSLFHFSVYGNTYSILVTRNVLLSKS